MAESLLRQLVERGYDFFTGVPDSLLKAFVRDLEGSDLPHVIATNEADALGIAVGAILSGRNACVYMQNSGLGNIVNPLTSLCIPYGFKPLLMIGHRHTLPQHEVMGQIDRRLLDLIGYDNYLVVTEDNNVD
jgi:phosphonopyruvate decarboxylase